MSFLNTGAPAPASFPAGENVDAARATIMLQAKYEVEGLTNFVTRLQVSCFNRCVNPHHGMDNLALSELTCIDRCVVKYIQTQTVVGEYMQKFQSEQQNNRATMTAGMQ